MNTVKLLFFAVTVGLSVTVCVGCDMAQSMNVRIFQHHTEQTLIVPYGASGYPEIQPTTGVIIAMKVVHELVDGCPGVNTFKKNSPELQQAITKCLAKLPPDPKTFIKARTYTNHDNNGEFYMVVATPRHWPNLVLLQITTRDGDNYYAHTYTQGNSKLSVIIPIKDQRKNDSGWGETIP